jgi:hypothetical protein
MFILRNRHRHLAFSRPCVRPCRSVRYEFISRSCDYKAHRHSSDGSCASVDCVAKVGSSRNFRGRIVWQSHRGQRAASSTPHRFKCSQYDASIQVSNKCASTDQNTDKPFAHVDSPVKSNNSNSGFRSALSPAPLSPAPPRSPFKMNRSVTAPAPRRGLAPPSPDYTSNLDSAFPRFPTKRSATPKNSQPQSRDRLEVTVQQRYAEPSPLFAPLSPRTDGGENVTKRLGSIAPGPFDGRADRRPSTSSASKSPVEDGPSFGHRRAGTQSSMKSSGSISKQRTSVTSSNSRGSSYSSRSSGLSSRPRPGTTTDSAPPPLPTSEKSEGIDAFLDRLQKESLKPSPALLDGAPADTLARQDSREKKEPPPRPRRPSEKDLPPSDIATLQPAAFIARSDSNTPPPRTASRNGQEPESLAGVMSSKKVDSEPLARPMFPTDAPMNPLHTPSDSGLSDSSYASSGFRSLASSRSSPPGSDAGHSREASKLWQSELFFDDNLQRTTSPDSFATSRTTPTQNGSTQVKEIPRNYERFVSISGLNIVPQPPTPSYSNIPESPMDPAIQMGTVFASRPRQPLPRQDPAIDVAPSPLKHLPELEPRREERRPTSKGNCRGCSEPIVGKSVKDSSGRLTGRYHKQCFVCRTCSDSFPTAEFYVFTNSPYCERHYHELNGSLCASCDRGIEGQYLATGDDRKFHPKCFTCTTCRVVLRDDYFEVGGQKYCDRHARHAANPPQDHLGPGSYRPRMEKRSTRLMMMA